MLDLPPAACDERHAARRQWLAQATDSGFVAGTWTPTYHPTHMNTSARTVNARSGPLAGLQFALGALLRLLLLGSALLLMLFALLAAGLLAIGMAAWMLVRGRKPEFRLFQGYYQRARRRQHPEAEPTVIDVEAVEVRPDQARQP